MPGNEVGDNIHNFLGQGSLSLGQHHSQLADSTWPGLSNYLCVGSQRQVGHPVSSVKNFSVNQLAEFDRGHSGQTSSLERGLNFTQSGMIQHLPSQQSGMTDMQLLQQLSILKQMQEYQRQQLPNRHFQLPEARQLSSLNQVSSFVKQGSDNLSPAPINGVYVHDASNYSWQPELMTPNANWMQHDAFSATQRSSGGFMFSPEQGKERLMGLVPLQDNQSFNGVFNSGARGNPYQYLSVQMDKPLSQQVPASSNSFPDNQFAMFSDQVGLEDGALVSRQGDQVKNLFGASALQGSNSVFPSENLQQMTIQPKNIGMESHGRQEEHLCQSETSLEKSEVQAMHSQNVASLDPTEEKILFGSDDSAWDIFGKSTNMGAVLDGADTFGEFPSLQSGSWSALMQSAVAETSSNDIGVQEEWSGLAVQSSEPRGGNMQSSFANDGSKQQLPGVDNNLQNASTLNTKYLPMSADANINRDFCSTLRVQQSGVQTANEQGGRMHNDSSQRFVQQLTEERSKWLDHSALQKPVAESAQLFGNVAHSPDVQASAKSISSHQSMSISNAHGQPYNKANGWNFIESASRSGGAISKSQDIESSSQPSHRDHKGVTFEERGHGSDLDRPVHEANIGPWNVNTGSGSSRVNMEGSDPGNVDAITDTRTTRVNKESSQQLPKGHNINLWKNIDSKVNFGLSRGSSKYQQNLDKSPQSFDSSGNNCLDTGMSEANMEENPNVKGSVGQFQHNRPSTSQSFGLQLGPPSQRFTIPDCPILSQSSPRVNSTNSVHTSPEVGRKGHALLGPTASVQSSTHGASQGDIRNNIPSVSGHTNNKVSQDNISGNVSAGFTSDYPYLESHLQCQLATDVGNQVIPNNVYAHFSGLASQSKLIDDSFERVQISQLGRISAPCTPETATDNDLVSENSWPRCSSQNNARDPDQQFPVLEAMPASQPSAMAESSHQGAFTKMPNVWTSVSAAHLLGAQSSRASQNLLKRHQQSNSNSETALPGAKKLDDQIARAGGSGPTEFPVGSAKPQNSVGEEQPTKVQQLLPKTDAGQNPASAQRDIETFGRSLRPNNIVHERYSLLHQMQAMKNIEIDPSNRSAKRFKGPTPESSLDAQQVSQSADQLSYGSSNMVRDALVNCPIVPSGDSKMLSLSSTAGDYHETQLSANDTIPFAQNDSLHASNANNSAGSLRGEHSHIRPQMAPSWFDRYGAFKHGIYDAQKIAMMKGMDKAFIVGRPSDSLHTLDSNEQVNAADASQLDDARQNSNLLPIASKHISRHLLPPGIPNQNLIVVSAKKRKSMTFEFVPWHKEVTKGCRRPQNISVAEAEWAHSANRLIEKVEYEPEMIEDWSPVLRSKRRLILTTQLMQQLHCAPPRAVLSADARKSYETVVYFVARVSLGEACSTAYMPESDTAVPSGSGSTLSEKLKERTQSLLKSAEEFVIRTKKLENDLQSLEKRASILDLRLECHDLEKVSLINRFAKFYGRGQADRAETSSSSEAIASPPKFFLQRYVSALPMPRNLPDKVQCLSL
ncbi:hypothetical protein HRI_003672900 [Hibiscus trionum]|uniref:Regulatory E2 n=1 Tax=Hibiscus trionum TaxID=183268 RepID=A0A9W7IQ61_HIBTR|nr:hypothetical protein HRI_003672900 [Hibiscus trionum]